MLKNLEFLKIRGPKSRIFEIEEKIAPRWFAKDTWCVLGTLWVPLVHTIRRYLGVLGLWFMVSGSGFRVFGILKF